jgi:hypothetical protein
VKNTTGDQLSFLELRASKDYEIASKLFMSPRKFGGLCKRMSIRFGREMHLTDDAWRFIPVETVVPGKVDLRNWKLVLNLVSKGYLLFYEGKTFHQYDDRWGESVRYLIKLSDIKDKPSWLRNSQAHRIVHRKISSGTNERTAIFCCLMPGVITGASCTPEHLAPEHPTWLSLGIMALGNTFSFDWTSRQLVASNFQDNIRDILPVPDVDWKFLSRGALRLSCNHEGFSSLWEQQLGSTWRESSNPYSWPVLPDEKTKWNIKSAIDTVVAAAYGLNRDQYEHVLKSFDRDSGPNPYTGLCLAKFDELKETGLDAFTKKYDPYWDIPLNEGLPKPVIDLSIPEDKESEIDIFGQTTQSKKRGRSKKVK